MGFLRRAKRRFTGGIVQVCGRQKGRNLLMLTLKRNGRMSLMWKRYFGTRLLKFIVAQGRRLKKSKESTRIVDANRN